MSSNLSRPIPAWLSQASDAEYQHAISFELSEREKERSVYRNDSAAPATSAASPLCKIFTGKSPDLFKYYSVAIGRNPTNRWGNRYSNIEPYDRTRVVVGTSETPCLGCGDGKGRYLNGSWVKELHGRKWWIATQAPLRGTAHAFLSVLTQLIGPSPDTSFPHGSRVRTVVQLTRNLENGRIKAHPYFPFIVGDSMEVTPEPGVDAQPYVVTLRELVAFRDASCIQCKVSFVSKGKDPAESITFTHMFYSAWPDHGIPKEEDQQSLLTFLRLVDNTNKSSDAGASNHPNPPIMVNCSAGVGRTGTFIAMSSLLRFYNLIDAGRPALFDHVGSVPTSPSPLGPLSQPDPVAQEVDALREQRPEMVQRGEQVTLIYQILEQAYLGK